LPDQVSAQAERIKILEKECGLLKSKIALGNIDEVVAAATEINGVKVTKEYINECDRASLEAKANAIISKMGSGVALIFAWIDGKGAILAAVSDDLVKSKKLNAGAIIKTLSEAAGGKGGGRPNLAQGGAKDLDTLKSVYDKLNQTLTELIK
jgi:alanyl-tRNA synthetase